MQRLTYAICTERIFLRVHLGGALELQHAGVVVGFARCCLGGADEVAQSFGHILHGIDEDHLQTTRTIVSTLVQVVGGFGVVSRWWSVPESLGLQNPDWQLQV